jgi:hypothetical protein
MKSGILFLLGLILSLSLGCSQNLNLPSSQPVVSLRLDPRSAKFDIDQVPQGAVRFTATIRNEGPEAITVAHPSVCLPPDYAPGATWNPRDFHGKSEILLQIHRPDGSEIVLRDGYRSYFDPGNIPVLTIPSGGTGTFDVGWFFQNARGRWERDDEAARVFLLKGTYKVRMLIRNHFPTAGVYDIRTREMKFLKIWTGEMKSREITVEIV